MFMSFLGFITESLSKIAFFAGGSTSWFNCYQPKEPEKLSK